MGAQQEMLAGYFILSGGPTAPWKIFFEQRVEMTQRSPFL